MENEIKEQILAYEKFFSSEDARVLLNDLVIFTQGCEDPHVRCGRADIILRILRQQQRGKESVAQATTRVRARVSTAIRETEE